MAADTPATPVSAPLDGPRLVDLLATLAGYLRALRMDGERSPERVAADLEQVNGLSDAIKRGLLADAALLDRLETAIWKQFGDVCMSAYPDGGSLRVYSVEFESTSESRGKTLREALSRALPEGGL